MTLQHDPYVDLTMVDGSPHPPAPPVKPRYEEVELGKVPLATVGLLSVMLVVGSVGDFVNAKTLLDEVFIHSKAYTSWCFAVSLTLLAVIATHVAGYLWREGRHRQGLRLLATAVLTVWAAAGVFLALARVTVADQHSAASIGQGNPFGQLTTSTGPHPLAIPLLLACVWAVTGLVSLAVGYLIHHPAGAALERLEATDRTAEKPLACARRDERSAAHTLDAHRLHRTRMPEAWRQAIAAAEAHRDELLAHTRLELTRVLGDPAATTDILPRPTNNPPHPTENEE